MYFETMNMSPVPMRTPGPDQTLHASRHSRETIVSRAIHEFLLTECMHCMKVYLHGCTYDRAHCVYVVCASVCKYVCMMYSCMHVCMLVCLPACLPLCLSLSVCGLSVCLSVCVSVCTHIMQTPIDWQCWRHSTWTVCKNFRANT